MLDEIRTFIALAESGSLQRAAERLNLTPSAVTRQVQRLEAALKTSLLDRRVKPGRITREGRAVIDGGRHMLRIMNDLKAQAMPLDVMHSALADRFKMLHGVSSIIYLIESLLGAFLAIKTRQTY